jgi:type IV pilus assembly protein PilA
MIYEADMMVIRIKQTLMKNEKGFTLIELMIVVAIIGVLASIAIPNFMSYLTKARQLESRVNLGAIGTNAEAWRAENNTFVATPTELGWASHGGTRYGYSYHAVLLITNSVAGACATSGDPQGAAATDVTFEAVANGDVEGDDTCDVWTYDQTRTLLNSTPDGTS